MDHTLSQLSFVAPTRTLHSVATLSDAVHGTLYVPRCVEPLLHTRVCQRLRHNQQLGTASWRFPSATISRLEHSLGVCHLAYRQATHLIASAPPSWQGRDFSTELNQIACAGLVREGTKDGAEAAEERKA